MDLEQFHSSRIHETHSKSLTSESIKDKFNNVISYQAWAPKQIAVQCCIPARDYQTVRLSDIIRSPDLDGKRFVANTECDRNEFLLLPIPIETDWLKLFPIPGFGRRALNFQIEILGNQVDLGQPLGLRYTEYA